MKDNMKRKFDMNMNIKKNQGGFTLVEMLLVVFLLALTMGLTSDMLLSLIRSNTKTQVINEIEQQANFVSLKIEKELRDSVDVKIPGGGTSGNSIELTLRSGSTVNYKLSGNVLERSLTGVSGTFIPLTSNSSPGGVAVSGSPIFTITGTNPKVVKLNMVFNQAQSGAGSTYKGSVKLDTSIVIRSSY